MTSSPLFLTGATGFVGRHLLTALAREGRAVRALVRDVDAARATSAVPRASVEWIAGDLTAPSAWAAALDGCTHVCHLAARTGNASPAEHERVNVGGTRALLDAARAAGVPRCVHVSTVAARYPEVRAYPYARSKARAEELVRAWEGEWTVVRPTIVVGEEAPGWRALTGLAALPLVPLLGGGRARVQPVHVDDVVALLTTLLDGRPLEREVIEVGGPEVLSMGALLRRLAQARSGRRARALPLPVRPLIGLLAGLERLGLRLPATAGQFYVFRYDSDARPHPLVEARRAEQVTLDAMCGLPAKTAAGGER